LTARSTKAVSILLAVCFLFSFVGAASVGEEFENAMYWLEKPAWNDLPSYAEDSSIQYSATDLIQEHVTRETCTEYNTTVFRFNDFRTGSFVLSDLYRVEVESGLEN